VDEVTIVGVHGGAWFGAAAGRALEAATVVIGAPRHLAALPSQLTAQHVPLSGPLDRVLEDVARRRHFGEKVCLVVSGDPGFFGLTRLARARLGAGGLAVHPAPSAVALAFARAGLAWDDAVVVSVHGRPLEPALDAVIHHSKVAVLTSPNHPPESVGRGLVAAGCGRRAVMVAARLGEPEEDMWVGDLAGLAGGRFDGLSVVLCLPPDLRDDSGPAWAWGLPDHTYEHRDGMITKAEVRAVALGKLRLPAAGVLWDVGAGSGSVAAECARLSPGLRVFAIERRPDDAHRLLANLAGTGAAVVEGDAPEILAGLPDPDRVFVGGGGLAVLDAVLSRVRPGGSIVATYAALDRATAAATRLGHLVQVAVSRGVPIGADGAVRLAADNPVFVCWGPEE
jgi:precorrin-6B C5,15-methyltransferase / cobalt-precorrin-6B C5,C15-methyltransferase